MCAPVLSTELLMLAMWLSELKNLLGQIRWERRTDFHGCPVIGTHGLWYVQSPPNNKLQKKNVKQRAGHNTQEVDATQMSTTRGRNKDHVDAGAHSGPLLSRSAVYKGRKALYFLQHRLIPEDTVLTEISRHRATSPHESAHMKDLAWSNNS